MYFSKINYRSVFLEGGGIRGLCLWAINKSTLAGCCREVCAEEICPKKQQLFGAERVLCAFQQRTKQGDHSTREEKVAFTAFLNSSRLLKAFTVSSEVQITGNVFGFLTLFMCVLCRMMWVRKNSAGELKLWKDPAIKNTSSKAAFFLNLLIVTVPGDLISSCSLLLVPS